MVVRLLVVFERPQRAGLQVVLEVEDLLLRRLLVGPVLHILLLLLLLHLALVFFYLLRGRHVELQRRLIHEADVLDGQVLGVPRVLRNAGELGGQALPIKDLPLRARLRIHDPVARPLGGLEAIPEPLPALDPLRVHREVVRHVLDLVRGKPGGQLVVGAAGPFHPLGLSRRPLLCLLPEGRRGREEGEKGPEHESPHGGAHSPVRKSQRILFTTQTETGDEGTPCRRGFLSRGGRDAHTCYVGSERENLNDMSIQGVCAHLVHFSPVDAPSILPQRLDPREASTFF